jgi:hypothetical protein
MEMFALCYPTLAVSTIYCIWSAYQGALLKREHALRERVAYMLWVLAGRISTGSNEKECY